MNTQHVEWQQSDEPVPYDGAVAAMESRVAEIIAGQRKPLVWLLEHPPLYTAGTSADSKDLLDGRFPVHHTGRGGEYTYHGPGQRIAYVMMDLKKWQKGPDLRAYITALEEWVIRSLRDVSVVGERRAGRVGIWVDMTRHGGVGECKIAAIGVRVRKWITYHGVSINVNPDLTHYNGIVPCGISEHGVTSLANLGLSVSMADLDESLKKYFSEVF